jgi:hypothetical protein
MEELRKWIDVATRVRATCQNVREFDRLIEHQKQRLEESEWTEHERRERDRRLSFGFSDNPDTETVVGTLPAMPESGRGRRRTAEEAATDRRLRKEREAEDLEAFLPCYQRATGLALEVEEESENPDFIARRPEFRRSYTIARDCQMEDLMDEMLEIADDSSRDYVEKTCSHFGPKSDIARDFDVPQGTARLQFAMTDPQRAEFSSRRRYGRL